VSVPLSRAWRERDLRRRIEVWEPRVGERATTTFARGRHLILTGAILFGAWVVVNVVLEIVGLRGVPIDVAAILFWPAALFFCVEGVPAVSARDA
jgi:hypothetical protein